MPIYGSLQSCIGGEWVDDKAPFPSQEETPEKPRSGAELVAAVEDKGR